MKSSRDCRQWPAVPLRTPLRSRRLAWGRLSSSPRLTIQTPLRGLAFISDLEVTLYPAARRRIAARLNSRRASWFSPVARHQAQAPHGTRRLLMRFGITAARGHRRFRFHPSPSIFRTPTPLRSRVTSPRSTQPWLYQPEAGRENASRLELARQRLRTPAHSFPPPRACNRTGQRRRAGRACPCSGQRPRLGRTPSCRPSRDPRRRCSRTRRSGEIHLSVVFLPEPRGYRAANPSRHVTKHGLVD